MTAISEIGGILYFDQKYKKFELKFNLISDSFSSY